MKVLILGGDGYLGWPTALRFKALGHDVRVLDSCVKRMVEKSEGVRPLVQLPDFGERCYYAGLDKYDFDLTDPEKGYGQLRGVFKDFEPDVIVHYAEQPSAPYSMKDVYACISTQYNNVIGTLNVLWAMRDVVPDAHLIKLGTMGEYGTPDCDIPDGYIEKEACGPSCYFDDYYCGQDPEDEDECPMAGLPFPKSPHSFYHLSKVHDSENIRFACNVWGLRATDLNQGVVYGVETKETRKDPAFRTSFHYDSIFGTVLNRFCVQAVAGHNLTVYGHGGQKRSFLNIEDTLECVRIAAENPPEKGRMRVFNQFTEIFSIIELAKLVQEEGEKVLGRRVYIECLNNPRSEQEDHYYNPSNKGLLGLGLKPKVLSGGVLRGIIGYIDRYHDGIDKKNIMPKVTWK